MTPQRVGASRIRSLEQALSPRDHRVLRLLDEHRFLTTSQITRVLFADHVSLSAGIRASVRVLDRLRRLRLIARLDRSVGGLHAGSRAFVWFLDSVGDRLLRATADEPARPRRRAFDPSLVFLEHTLAVAEARVALEEAAHAGAIVLEDVETEPAAWRRYVDEYGRPAVLKPDLAVVTSEGDYEDHWFIEVDRGTESLRTLLAKCAAYEAYRRTGIEQGRSGVFPLAVWLVPSERRRARLIYELGRARDLDRAVFRVCAPDGLVDLVTGTSLHPEGEATPRPSQLTRGGLS